MDKKKPPILPLNEHFPNFEEERKNLEGFVRETIKEKFGPHAFRYVRFLKDSRSDGKIGLGTFEINIRLDPNNIKNICKEYNLNFKKTLECIAIHEVFHPLYRCSDDEFIWDKVILHFPQFSKIANLLRKLS